MKKYIVLLLFFLYKITDCIAIQSTQGTHIKGIVTNASTQKSLHFANVFLSGTSLGAATDDEGRFVIYNIPPGTYTIVVSMMGYETRTQIIELYDLKHVEMNFRLKPIVLKGERVSVTGEIPKEWKKNLKVFERAFFGLSEFAGACKFKNPEVLDFEYDRKQGLFKASAERPLIFINHALGYEVNIRISEFTARLFNGDIYSIEQLGGTYNAQHWQKGSSKCTGTAFFVELTPGNDKQVKKWIENRQRAYRGSKRHFLKSLYANRIKNEGFRIYGSMRIYSDSNDDYKVGMDELLKPAKNPQHRILSFPDFLKVVYKKESDEIRK